MLNRNRTWRPTENLNWDFRRSFASAYLARLDPRWQKHLATPTAFRGLPADIRLLANLQSLAHFGNANVRKDSKSQQEPTRNSVSRDGHVVYYSNQSASLHNFTQPRTGQRQHLWATSVSQKSEVGAINTIAHSGIPLARDSPKPTSAPRPIRMQPTSRAQSAMICKSSILLCHCSRAPQQFRLI